MSAKLSAKAAERCQRREKLVTCELETQLQTRNKSKLDKTRNLKKLTFLVVFHVSRL